MNDLSSDNRSAPNPLLGYRSNEEWQNLLGQFATLAQAVEEIEDESTRGRVTALLQATDAIHREAMHRLVRLFKDGVLEQVITDPAIHTLMGMYDLLPEADPACRKIWDFIADPTPAFTAASHEIAQRAEEQPRWMPLSLDIAPSEGEAVVVALDNRFIVIAQVDRQHFAAAAQCPAHGITMTGGHLSGYSWICDSGPGCVYDIRNGSRLGGGRGLDCHPVRLSKNGEIRIGLGIPFQPQLPAF
jgi:nitrite reductase/ring-hydroxylating ferredoxin subunit